jgi:PAS domain S-box-containing protein
MTDFFKLSNELMCEANADGYFTRVNPAWTTTLGWSEEELTSRPYVEFVHPDDREATYHEAGLLNRGNHNTIHFENRYRCRDGGYRWLAWMSVVERESGKLIACARDVTKERTQELALRRSEERLRLVMEVTGHAIWDFDAVAGTIWWNDEYERSYGPQPDEGCERHARWRELVHPNDRQRVFASFRQAIDSGAETWSCEYRVRRNHGDYALVLDRALLARGADRRVTRVLGAMQDITSIRESELYIRERESTIRQMFELQERERRLTSHDIHDGLAQTLFGALMNIEATRATLEEEQGAALDLALELMRKAARECRRLINDLRPMVIEESGIEESIRHLIAETLRVVVCNVSFECELPPERYDHLFEGVVFRIVQEAIGNAIRHGRAERIAIQLKQVGTEIDIQVEDDGVGFDLSKIPPDRFGVRGIQERARLFHGSADFIQVESGGTRVHARLQVPCVKH